MSGRNGAIILITLVLALGTVGVVAAAETGRARPTSVGVFPTAKGQFADGLWRVNIDIQPGVYLTVAGGGCYWQRLANLSGRFNAITRNGGPYLPNTPLAVTVMPDDMAFHSSGCGLWTRL